jgi:hypothetical protein
MQRRAAGKIERRASGQGDHAMTHLVIGFLAAAGLGSVLVLGPARPVLAGASPCVANTIQLVDRADGDLTVTRGGEVIARAQVTNCGERGEAVRSDLFVEDIHHRQVGQLTHTAVLAPGQTLTVERVLAVPAGAEATILCYLLMSQAINAPIVTRLSDPACIQIVDR